MTFGLDNPCHHNLYAYCLLTPPLIETSTFRGARKMRQHGEMYRRSNSVCHAGEIEDWVMEGDRPSLIKQICHICFNFLPRTVDNRTKDWAMVLEPVPMAALVILYIQICAYWGPRLMKTRPPVPCKHFYVHYCFLNSAANFYTFYELLMGGWLYEYNLTCQSIDYLENPTSKRMVSAMWCFYVIKLYELMDTVFYVVWKKDKYRTVLHFHHHTSMLLLAWLGVQWFPGGHGSIVCLINTFNHMVGYLSFGLAKLRKCLWLKVVVRVMSIMEVLVVMIHLPQVYFGNCNYPALIVSVILVNTIPVLIYAIYLYQSILLPRKKHAQLGNSTT